MNDAKRSNAALIGAWGFLLFLGGLFVGIIGLFGFWTSLMYGGGIAFATGVFLIILQKSLIKKEQALKTEITADQIPVPVPEPSEQSETPTPTYSTLIPCPGCGHEVSKHAKSCPNCGHPIDTKVYCPKCGSSSVTVIGGANKVASVAAFGVFAANNVINHYKCNTCKHKF